MSALSQKESPHLIRSGIFKIHRAAPGRVVRIGDIGPKLSGVIAGRTEVVVYHIEQHGQPFLVRRIDKPLERVGAAIGFVHGKERDAVVAPAMIAFKRSYRHQLNMRNAETHQVVQPFDCGIEGALSVNVPIWSS